MNLGLHRRWTNLRSFPRKRESRGQVLRSSLGQRTGSPLSRGRTELRGDSNSSHLALACPRQFKPASTLLFGGGLRFRLRENHLLDRERDLVAWLNVLERHAAVDRL